MCICDWPKLLHVTRSWTGCLRTTSAWRAAPAATEIFKLNLRLQICSYWWKLLHATQVRSNWRKLPHSTLVIEENYYTSRYLWLVVSAQLEHTQHLQRERERVLYWQPSGPNSLNHRDDLSRLAVRHRNFDSLFQVAVNLLSYERDTRSSKSHLGGAPREQKMLEGHLPRVIFHQVY